MNFRRATRSDARALRRAGEARSRRRGAAVVELAVITPLVMTLALATTDFGRAVHAYNVVSNAARVGAERGATTGFTTFSRSAWESKIRQAVTEEMLGLTGYQPTEMQTTIDVTYDAANLPRTGVRVTYGFQTIVNWPGLPSRTELSHRVEMRRVQ